MSNFYFGDIPSARDPWNNEGVIYYQRTRFLVPVKQSALLISQIQRSGGTFLNQLLDGHPELHVHPSELHIGRPNKYFWPELDVNRSPAELFEMLWEHPALLHARDGYSKSGVIDNPPLPFVFLGSLQRYLFEKVLTGFKTLSQRQIIDAYLTSYFNAWIDYRGLYRDPSTVKYWNAFCARLLYKKDNVDRFFQDYPDGLIISIVREPVSWYASAARYNPKEYSVPEIACELWKRSTAASLDANDRYAGRVLLMSFEDLVSSPNEAVADVCRFAGLRTSNTSSSPTFNSMPIHANSSFNAYPGKMELRSQDRTIYVESNIKSIILKECLDLYRQALLVIGDHRGYRSNRISRLGARFLKVFKEK